MQEESGFKVGDKVRVLRKAGNYEMGWGTTWAKKKDNWVGEIGEVVDVDLLALEVGFTIGFNIGLKEEESWYFPFFVLEKVEEEYYCVGDRFIKDDEIFVLMVDDCGFVGLFSLKTYFCYNNSVDANDFNKITSKELSTLLDEGFELYEKSPLREGN